MKYEGGDTLTKEYLRFAMQNMYGSCCLPN